MNLTNCSRCGRIFDNYSKNNEFCPSCLKITEENYRKIFEFFDAQPSATAQEISEATGVEVKEIYRFVRENRLRLAKVDTGLKCERCGGPILGGKLGGKFCEKCRSEFASDILKNAQKQNASGLDSQKPPKPGISEHSKPSKDSKKPKKY
jgi:protein-arginine kinase activator protein McsA